MNHTQPFHPVEQFIRFYFNFFLYLIRQMAAHSNNTVPRHSARFSHWGACLSSIGCREKWFGKTEIEHIKLIAFSFPFNTLTRLLGRQEGHPACKKAGCRFVGGDDLTGALLVV